MAGRRARPRGRWECRASTRRWTVDDGRRVTASGCGKLGNRPEAGSTAPARRGRTRHGREVRNVRARVSGAARALGGRTRSGSRARSRGLFRRGARREARDGASARDAGDGTRGVVRRRRSAGLPLAAAHDDVQGGSLLGLRGARSQSLRRAGRGRHALPPALRSGAGSEVGEVHHRRAVAGRTAGGAPDHRPQLHSDGRAAHAPPGGHRALVGFRAGRRSPQVVGRAPGAR